MSQDQIVTATAAGILGAGAVITFVFLLVKLRPRPKHAAPRRAGRRPAFADDHLIADPDNIEGTNKLLAALAALPAAHQREIDELNELRYPPLSPEARKAMRDWGAR